jgi:hypothetical protein
MIIQSARRGNAFWMLPDSKDTIHRLKQPIEQRDILFLKPSSLRAELLFFGRSVNDKFQVQENVLLEYWKHLANIHSGPFFCGDKSILASKAHAVINSSLESTPWQQATIKWAHMAEPSPKESHLLKKNGMHTLAVFQLSDAHPKKAHPGYPKPIQVTYFE